MNILSNFGGSRRVAGACVFLLVLAACSTPQERCVRDVNRDLQTVTGLIAETEVNLARGYTYETEVQYVRVGVTGCVGGVRYYRSGVWVCGATEPRAVQRAVPIDPQTEQRQLAGLKKRQAELTELAARAQAVCLERYPA